MIYTDLTEEQAVAIPEPKEMLRNIDGSYTVFTGDDIMQQTETQ